MSFTATLALAFPALVAVVGFFLTYRNNLRLAERKDRLDRVNRQLEELYGPLIALVHAGNRCWEVFRSQYRPSGGYWNQQPPPTEAEAEAWRVWISTIFMPLNRQMRDVIVMHADLLEGDNIEPCLLDLCAHVASYEAILKRWEVGDFDEHKPPLAFPRDELPTYVAASFKRLKAEQKRLLRKSSSEPA